MPAQTSPKTTAQRRTLPPEGVLTCSRWDEDIGDSKLKGYPHKRSATLQNNLKRVPSQKKKTQIQIFQSLQVALGKKEEHTVSLSFLDSSSWRCDKSGSALSDNSADAAYGGKKRGAYVGNQGRNDSLCTVANFIECRPKAPAHLKPGPQSHHASSRVSGDQIS